MALTAQELWNFAWPDFPWEDAGPWERKLYLDHAASLRDYEEA